MENITAKSTVTRKIGNDGFETMPTWEHVGFPSDFDTAFIEKGYGYQQEIIHPRKEISFDFVLEYKESFRYNRDTMKRESVGMAWKIKSEATSHTEWNTQIDGPYPQTKHASNMFTADNERRATTSSTHNWWHD